VEARAAPVIAYRPARIGVEESINRRPHAFRGDAHSEIAGGVHDQRDKMVRIVGCAQLFLEKDIRQNQRAEAVERLASGTHA